MQCITHYHSSLGKITLAAFSIVAGLICLGLIGDQGYIGTKVLLGSGGFAPNGYWSIVLTMVIILVNFQGTEIIGLAAGECEKPECTVRKTNIRSIDRGCAA